MPSASDIDKLLSDRDAFNSFIYTSFEEAIEELNRRKGKEHVLGLDVPEIMRNGPRFVIFRHIATPNYEIRRFMSAADAAEVKPLILEYTADIFRSLNQWKYSLAKIGFYKGRDKKGGLITEHRNIIDFNTSNSKPLSEISTTWNQGLVDFHHEFFLAHFPEHRENIFDLSKWLHENGHNAKSYYKSFLSLFLGQAILFENFSLEGEELSFTRDVILPAFMEIVKETGHKPLIVALEPTEIEDDLFWLCHPHDTKKILSDKIKTRVLPSK
jgi:hypothetical protein